MRKPVFKIGGVVVTHDTTANALYFRSRLTIDDDGDPRCYAPGGKGRDYLANAGHKGNWWGIVTDSKGNPLLQKVGDPAPGFYISATSLQDPYKKVNDPNRYVNAWIVPYVALPAQMFSYMRLGDLGMAIFNGKTQAFIVADTGGRGHIGEGSPALAEMLGANKDPKSGGIDSNSVGYVLYPESGTGKPLTVQEIEARTAAVVFARRFDPLDYFTTKQALRKNTQATSKVAIRR